MPPLCAKAVCPQRKGCALHSSTGRPGEAHRRCASPARATASVATAAKAGSALALVVDRSTSSSSPAAYASPQPSAWIRESWAKATKLSSPRTSRSDSPSFATQPSSRHISDRPPPPSSHVLAHPAGDVDRGAGDVAGPVARQERDDPGHLRDIAEPAQRHLCRRPLGEELVLRELGRPLAPDVLPLRRHHETDVDAVDQDALGP